jgi:hypothetical protein
MPRLPPVFAAALVVLLLACSPVFNWRNVRLPGAGLKLLLPCKPDHANRTITLAGQTVEIQMAGCETGGALFAVSHADLKDKSTIPAALEQWRLATLGNMQAQQDVQALTFKMPGADATPQALRVRVRGRRQDGSAVEAQAEWFARGPHLYHAVVYADRLDRDVADAFFSGIEFE